MKSDDILKACCAEIRRRFPGCDAEAEMRRLADTADDHAPPWTAGLKSGGGWIATLNVIGRNGVVIARHEVRGYVPGRVAATLAKTIGVEVTP